MYSKELEELIENVLADGVITDAERTVLRKRAQACGEDPDEVIIVVEGRLAKAQNANPAKEKRGNIVKCPNCGAVIEAGAVRCAECGHVFTNVKANSSSIELAKKLAEVQNSYSKQDQNCGRAMAGVIRSFPIPTAKEDLIEFISSMLPNIVQHTIDENDAAHYLPDAYFTKVQECLVKAQVLFPDDPQMEALLKMAKKTKTKRTISIFTHSIGFWLFFVPALAILLIILFAK